MARIGLTLLGIFFIITSALGALGGLPKSFVEFDSEAVRYVMADNLLPLLGATVGGMLFLRLLPGVLLIAFRARIADRLFPASALTSSTFNASRFYVIGCTLLAFYVLIYAIAGIISGIAYFLVTAFSDLDPRAIILAIYLAPFLASLTQFALGVLLYRHARRYAATQNAETSGAA